MKNLLLSLAMLCTTGAVFAQLYVTPNASTNTDSYIYVDDEVLYVEEEVNLVRNVNDPTTEASIYLRNEAQLLQGDSGNMDNDGTGLLSVYQDSNSDSYDYNFWASPIGGHAVPGSRPFGITKLWEVQGLTDATQAENWEGLNGVASPLKISRRWFYYWDVQWQRWVAGGTSNSVKAGNGFTMKGTEVTTPADGTTVHQDANNQVYDFRGRPNNGDIYLPVQTNQVPWTDGNLYYFTLAGNPYPSALDLKDVFYDPENEEIEEFNYWDEDRSINSHDYEANKGGYGTWIPGPEVDDANPGMYTVPTFMNYDDTGAPISTAGGYTLLPVERRFAPIGQGFMIRALDSIANDPASQTWNDTIVIRNSHRQYVKEGAANNSEWKFRDESEDGSKNSFGPSSIPTTTNDDGPSGTDDIPTPDYSNYTPQIRIHTVFDEGTHFRDMVLAFHNTATDQFDRGMDASHPMDGVIAEAFMPIDTRPLGGGGGDQGSNSSSRRFRNLVIQTIPFDDPRKMVPIAFVLDEEMSVEVRVVQEINVPFIAAYLHDSEANTYEKITDGEISTRMLPAGEYKNRFFITFRAAIQDEEQQPYEGAIVDDLLSKQQEEFVKNVEFVQNNPVAQLQVNNPEGYDVKQLAIYDMSGKLVLNQQNLGTQRSLRFPTSNFSDGVYLVRLTTVDNLKVDYKINVFNK